MLGRISSKKISCENQEILNHFFQDIPPLFYFLLFKEISCKKQEILNSAVKLKTAIPNFFLVLVKKDGKPLANSKMEWRAKKLLAVIA